MNLKSNSPIIDESNYQGNLDMELIPEFKDLASLKAQLNKYGLDLVEGERELEMMIIADREAEMKDVGGPKKAF